MRQHLDAKLTSKIRDTEITRLRHLAFESSKGASIVLVGRSGVGKTFLMHQLRALDQSASPGPVVDASQPSNRTRLGLAASIIGRRPIGKAREFITLAGRARLTGASAQTTYAALQCFEECLADLSTTQSVVYLDNVDFASGRTLDWLLSMLHKTPNIHAVAAAQSSRKVPAVLQPIEIHPFTIDQTTMLIRAWQRHDEYNAEQLAKSLNDLTSGNAVSIGLALWALGRSTNRSIPDGESLVKVVQRATNAMTSDERGLWLCALAARVRIAPAIIDQLSNASSVDSFFGEFSSLPFVTEKNDAFGGFVLHPIAEAVLVEALHATSQELLERRGRLCHDVYPKLISREPQPATANELFLERLGYLSEYDLSAAANELESAFASAARTGRLNDAEAVAKVAENILEHRPEAATIRLQLLSAENALMEHTPETALRILTSIPVAARNSENVMLVSKFNYLKARCATGEATARSVSVFDAIELLSSTLAMLRGRELEPGDLDSCIRFELASALRLVGRNVEALEYYKECAEKSADTALRVRACEEQSQVYRLMQNLDKAESALSAANSVRNEFQLPFSGIATYYMANILRDRGNFSRAASLYEKAATQFQDAGDDFALCCVFGDHAWMSYLDDRIELSRTLLEKSKRIADAYCFGREIAEYWHSTYHLMLDEGKLNEAYDALENGYRFAKDYGNIYIELDCAMHLVQRAVQQKRLNDVPAILREMEEIEGRGAGIMVFRGRALVYSGDGLFDNSDESEAYFSWKRGFELVARYGNSRSNVELLGDIIRVRLERFRYVEGRLGFSGTWPDRETEAELPELARMLRADT